MVKEWDVVSCVSCAECHERVPDHTYLTSGELCEACTYGGLRLPTGRVGRGSFGLVA